VRTTIAIALLSAGLFVVVGPRLGWLLAPATAVRLLVPASLLVAGSSALVLGTMAFTWVGQLPEIAEIGPWSSAVLRASNPVPTALAVLSGVLLVPATLWAMVHLGRRGQAILAVHRSCRHLGPPGSLVMLDEERPDAFTTPERIGRIVVTTGLFDNLDADERRALLAHERSHQAHQHAWWVLAIDLAAAVNPLLRPTARAVRHATERWADEDAAVTVADRRLVARTVARAALLQHRGPRRSAPVAAVTGGETPQRVQALLVPKPRPHPAAVALLGVLVATVVVAAVTVQHQGTELFESAVTVTQEH
jgi:hypothetical protein